VVEALNHLHGDRLGEVVECRGEQETEDRGDDRDDQAEQIGRMAHDLPLGGFLDDHPTIFHGGRQFGFLSARGWRAS
jgi:hypothetical protein